MKECAKGCFCSILIGGAMYTVGGFLPTDHSPWAVVSSLLVAFGSVMTIVAVLILIVVLVVFGMERV